MDHGPRPRDPGAPPADGLPRVLSLFQHAQLHLPAPRDLQPRPDAAVLSRRGRHEDRLHRGVWPQSRDQRGAQRRAPDRRRAGRRSNPERDAHMATLLDQGFEQMDVPPERRTAVANRLPSLVGTAHAATVTARRSDRRRTRRITAGWTIQVGSFASERAAREAASNARRVADGGEVRIEPASQRGRTIWRAQVIGLTAGRGAGCLRGAVAASVGVHGAASGSAAGGKPLTARQVPPGEPLDARRRRRPTPGSPCR